MPEGGLAAAGGWVVKPPKRLVLDTNVVLDWLVFADIPTHFLTANSRTGGIFLLTHSPALDELRRVLAYPALKLDLARQAAVLASYQSQISIPNLPVGFSLQNLLLPAGFPRCRDPDDQHFLALAWHAQAEALVSRDKAVLSLNKRAARFGVRIMDVQQMLEWLAE